MRTRLREARRAPGLSRCRIPTSRPSSHSSPSRPRYSRYPSRKPRTRPASPRTGQRQTAGGGGGGGGVFEDHLVLRAFVALVLLFRVRRAHGEAARGAMSISGQSGQSLKISPEPGLMQGGFVARQPRAGRSHAASTRIAGRARLRRRNNRNLRVLQRKGGFRLRGGGLRVLRIRQPLRTCPMTMRHQDAALLRLNSSSRAFAKPGIHAIGEAAAELLQHGLARCDSAPRSMPARRRPGARGLRLADAAGLK